MYIIPYISSYHHIIISSYPSHVYILHQESSTVRRTGNHHLLYEFLTWATKTNHVWFRFRETPIHRVLEKTRTRLYINDLAWHTFTDFRIRKDPPPIPPQTDQRTNVFHIIFQHRSSRSFPHPNCQATNCRSSSKQPKRYDVWEHC